MSAESVTKNELISFLENEAKMRIDTMIEGAMEMAEEVHAGVVLLGDAAKRQIGAPHRHLPVPG